MQKTPLFCRFAGPGTKLGLGVYRVRVHMVPCRVSVAPPPPHAIHPELVIPRTHSCPSRVRSPSYLRRASSPRTNTLNPCKPQTLSSRSSSVLHARRIVSLPARCLEGERSVWAAACRPGYGGLGFRGSGLQQLGMLLPGSAGRGNSSTHCVTVRRW